MGEGRSEGVSLIEREIAPGAVSHIGNGCRVLRNWCWRLAMPGVITPVNLMPGGFSMLKKELLRRKRHRRVRKSVVGTATKPRLNVYRSISNIYAQVIDDDQGKTIVSASTLDGELKSKLKSGGNAEAAKMVGELIGKRAIEKGVETVVFDRGGFKYHGRVAALADGARAAGLKL